MKVAQHKLLVIAAVAAMLCMAELIMPGTSSARHCVDNGDRTVTDYFTGLTWQKDMAGYGHWDAAMSYASGLSLAGHSGWRLPSRDELAQLYHSDCKSLMDVGPFSYWSSTTYAGRTDSAWRVDFGHGDINHDDTSSSYYFRAVRHAQ